MRERQAQLSKNSKLKIKVVEQGGVRIKSLLSKADPFPTQDCISERCPVCRTTAFTELGKKSQFRTPCSAMGVGYSVTCVNCEKLGRKSSYEGETGRPARVRFAEHISEFVQILSYLVFSAVSMYLNSDSCIEVKEVSS